MARRAQPQRRGFGSLRRLPSSRWQAIYSDPDGGRVKAPITFETKADAEAWLTREHAAILDGRWKGPVPEPAVCPAFSTYARAWLVRRELRPRTREEYSRLLDAIDVEFGSRRLDRITPQMVRSWFEAQDPDKPTQRAHRYALLRTIMGSALEDELIESNPCRVRGAGRAKRARKIRPATLAELSTMMDAIAPRWRALLLVATWGALRFGELTEMRRKDLDLDAGVIRVRRAVTWVDGNPIVGLPKSEAGARDVSIPPHVVPILREHIGTHAEPGREGLVFPAASGGHLNHGSFYKAFRKARSAAGREDLRLHDMRHTGAVLAAQAGATTRELMDRLGHTTAEMAMRYQHVADGRQAEIARRLSAMATEAEPP